jgi:TRAP-type mannitol/chloroaromatic compound transport system substrate-binding protein
MSRRSTAGPERAKSRRRKTVTQKRRGLRNPSAADHGTQSDVAQLIRDREEALEREKAAAEVLRVISSSPGELEPVFQAMLVAEAGSDDDLSKKIYASYQQFLAAIIDWSDIAEGAVLSSRRLV